MYLPIELVVTFASSLLNWTSRTKTSIHLGLTPQYAGLQASSIDAHMVIAGRHFHADQDMLQLVLDVGRVPSMNYTGTEAIRSWDDEGELELTCVEADMVRRWHPVRSTIGHIHLGFTVYPRHTTVATPPGPRIDFRVNDGGLVGTGNVFIPAVLELSTAARPTVYDLDVRWDLSEAPAGTTAVWTFGEGAHVVYRGTINTLVNSIYMVGTSIRSYVDPSLPGFGFYYLTKPPAHFLADPNAMAKQIARLFPAMTSYFNQQSDTYRVFLRESPRGYGGSAFEWSFMIEWDEAVQIGRGPHDPESQADDLYFLVAHEMAHNWPTMQGPPGDQEDANTTWFEEGIATYYQAVLPYESGLITREKFIAQMNDILSAYYTSPAIALTSVQCTQDAWTNTHAQRLPYYRGVLYLLHLDGIIRRGSSGHNSLRELVNWMVQRRFAGESHTFDDFFRTLADYTDVDKAMDLYMVMSAGSWVVPPPANLVGQDALVVRQDQARYDAGYTTITDRHGDVRIASVKAGSNADLAGCRVGDILTWSRYAYGSMDDYERNQTMTLRRQGQDEEFEVSFWPRGKLTVESWQYV